MTEQDFWRKLCGNETFIIWNSELHNFGPCFEKICISIVAHIILAIISSFHFSKHYNRRVRGDIPKHHVLNVRFLVTVILVIIPLILIVVSLASKKVNNSIINILTWIIDGGSFLIHSGFVWRLRRYYHLHVRGPLSIVLSFLATTLALAIHLYDIIVDVTRKGNYVGAVEEYIAYVKAAFHLVYILTLIPSKRPELTPEQLRTCPNYSINYAESEEQPLLSSHTRTLPEDKSLGIAEDGKSFLSKLFFCWANPLMFKGYKGKISGTSDFFDLPKGLKTSSIEEDFQKAISKQVNTRKEHNTSRQTYPTESTDHRDNAQSDNLMGHNLNVVYRKGKSTLSLIRALNSAFGWECWSLGVLKFVGDSLNFAGPILLNMLVSYMENGKELTWHGYVYALGLFSSTFLSSMFSIHFGYRISVLGLKVRAALITSVYKKALSVSTVSLSGFSTGEVVNFMSTDTDRIVNFAPSFHQFWSLPIQVGVSLYLLYSQVGLAFLAGLGFAVLLIPINRWLAIKIGKLSTEMMHQKDSRVKVMNESLFGIRVIKFYAWEEYFTKKINILRDAELSSLKGRKYLDAFCVFFWATTPVLISILTFSTYALMGNQLTAAKVFTSMALFNILIMPLNAFPWVINGLMEAWVSVKRLQKYLNLTELDLAKYYLPYSEQDQDDGTAISIKNGFFSWYNRNQNFEEVQSTSKRDEESDIEPQRTLLLRYISAHIHKGCTIGIVGKVGSGKSSLLNAILAEMNRERGTISVCCLEQGFGYAAQEAWIQHATVRDNILFGKAFDPEKYEGVLDACALREDLKILPAGDKTEIGENGVTLSGGQKARVALARAVYQDKSVYLLDDPFAAVDTHVANHLFTGCIKGLLRDKTVILCTHHTKFLQDADHVIVLNDGRIQSQGPPDVILSSADLESLGPEKEKKVEDEDECEMDNVEQVGLVEEEEKDTGVVKFEVYMIYWNAVGRILGPLVLLSLFLMQASKNVGDWWLSYWVTHSHNSSEIVTNHHPQLTSSHHSQVFLNSTPVPWTNMTYGDDNKTFYLTVYGGIAGANIIFALARSFSFAYGGVCAATKIHIQLLGSILKAPIKFFDVTPIGRILNRFSSDLYAVDDSLPFVLNIFLAQSFGFVGSLVVTCYGLPWFLLLLAPLAIVYYIVQKYYRHTSREVKRITSVTLSPIYAHFSETVTGLTTIRAHREQIRFEETNRTRLEENQKAQLAVNVAGTWLNIRLQMMGVTMVTGVAFIAVLEHHFRSVNPGLVGLAISYALSITGLMSGMVQCFTETEKQMVSVERAAQYIEDVPHEKEDSLIHTPENWPNEGAVLFKHVQLQYRYGLPFALNGVSFHVKPAEKIGIVGRTGSGKSSLFLTLFRMVEISSGEIEIDGVNTAYIPLFDLRSKMAIIPQDPFLFSGSIRENLDPQNYRSNTELNQVIDRCHLRDVVDRLGGLNADVKERGKQFSAGQRQLMCLARALLTRAKILCIDEATASVDRETDEKLQMTIQNEFINNTVLTIAHRISTIQQSDRVLVMDNGSVAEFDSPENLLLDSDSIFYSLVNSKKTL